MGLRKWFGPSRKAIWRQLSTEMDGRYVEGRFNRGDRIEVTHEPWTVTLDTYARSTGKTTLVFTRMRAPYVNPTGFRFTIYRKSVFSDVGKLLGMQDIEIGDPPFDDDFIIKGTDEGQVRALLANEKIRSLIAQQPKFHLTVKDDEGWFGRKFGDEVDELSFEVIGAIKDAERLKLLYELFAETLDHLCAIGAAYEQTPQIDA